MNNGPTKRAYPPLWTREEMNRREADGGLPVSNDPNVPFEATTIYHNATTFYFGSNFNLNGEPRVDVARALIRVLEDLTGWECTSRWPWSPHPGGLTRGSTREIMALTDLTDLRAPAYVILPPLNGTAPGG